MDLKICRICLRTEVRGYKFDKFQLKSYYEEVLALKVNDQDGLPHYFCYECATFLHKFHKFKVKCYTGQKVLKEILWRGPISYEAIYKIDPNDFGLQSTLQKNCAFRVSFENQEHSVDIKTEKPTDIQDSEDPLIVNEYMNADEEPVKVVGTKTEDEETSHCISVDIKTEKHTGIQDSDDPLTDNKNRNADEEMVKVEGTKTEDEETSHCRSVGIQTDKHTGIQDSDDPLTDNKCRNAVEELVIVEETKTEVEESSHRRRSSKSEDELTLADVKKKTEQNKASVRRKRKFKHYNNDGEETNIRDIILKSNDWKVFTLNEEEAVTAFRAKSEDKKYLEAAFKCTDCFKGFSKEMILKRHIKLRHSESIGKFVCRFCHARFKMDCYLRRHMKQHYAIYKCLRCSLVCDLEYTAFMHNNYHSGVARKCVHCDQEFRHLTSYYTHLRTHRSKFVCALCGASFVSDNGLQQHKRVTHAVDDVEICDDDDEAVNTYCDRCDIRFETGKAYKEHLIHSVMHTEELNEAVEDNETMPKKVLEKNMQNKITNEIPNVTPNEVLSPPAHKKKLRRPGRPRPMKASRKPTTCHQCGKSFETQLACMKHHVAEHPRTSFFPPTERQICEICGVSLAPTSVAAHQNMHTKEKMYSCSTCGRQFYSSMCFKRHQLTHTGEKPHACPLCDKRFKQSNGMKLHYRTFHLKEPYPKRNRRKNKEERELEASTSFSGLAV